MEAFDPASSNAPPDAGGRLAGAIAAATCCRLLLNTARRFAYPFAPVLSRGLGVPLPAITSLIAVNQASSLVGIFTGPLADRVGYRRLMLAGLGLLAIGMLAAGWLPTYAVVMAGLLLAGLGKCVFDPAMQAYVGERIPFQRRGLVIGLIEFSWAGATLLGIPLIGYLIAGWGWRAPFFTLGGLSLAGMFILGALLAKDRPRRLTDGNGLAIHRDWRLLLAQRRARGVLGFAFCANAANDNLFVVCGVWLESSFGLSVVALGLSATVIGLAELTGETLTALVADRLGLKRGALTGAGLALAGYAALPLLAHSMPQALSGLFFIFLSFEFTIVTVISLCTELVPRQRATMMAAFYAAAGLGRIAGALLGGVMWIAGEIAAIGIGSAAITALGAFLLWRGLKGWNRS